MDVSFSLAPPTTIDAGSGRESLAGFSLSKRLRFVVSTAFDPAVTSYADVDRLLRTEPQVQLTPFVLNNHSNSLKSHGGKGPLRWVAEDTTVAGNREDSSSLPTPRFVLPVKEYWYSSS